MKRFAMIALLIAFASPMMASAEAIPDKPAPTFKEKDASGKEQSLDALKGKWVVLEWFNKDCPYVKKHYGAKNMQKLQKTYGDKGVVWLTVISSIKGTQGHQTPAEATKVASNYKGAARAILLDENGDMGKAYGAKTTPHMYVINPNGDVVFAGGIDDNDSSDPKVIPKSKNFVAAALDSAMAGKPVETKTARPSGCTIKYE
jgi:peroxiredoxin